MINKLIVGTRSSNLAITQTNYVIKKLKEKNPSTDFILKKIKTKGDILLNKDLNKILDKGFFVSEIQNELEKKTIDFAIHSLKDLPSEGNNNLSFFTVTKREDPMDVLVLKKGLKTKKIHDIKIIGTSSKRRKEQIKKIYNGVKVKSIRGNVETRIKKLDNGEFEGIILAAAGLKRLGLEHRISKYFKSDEIIPAAGQGALAVEFRKDDKKTFSILKKIQDKSTQICIDEERKFLKTVGGGCSSPDAVLCISNGDKIEIKGKVFDINKKKYISGKMTKEIGNHIEIGEKLAKKLMSKISNKISTHIILTNDGDISGFNELSKSDIITHHFPLIDISPLDFTVDNIEKYDYIIFTSKNGVKNFFNRVKVSSEIKFICIGNKTNQTLNEYGYESAYISKRNYSNIMSEELKNNGLLNGKKSLLVQGKIAKYDFKTKLKDFCEVDRVNVYETNLKNKVNKELLKLIETKETYTVFTSPSAFDSFIQFYKPEDTKIISIGKTTTDYVNSKGFDCMLTSKMQSYEGISESLIKYFYQK
tara:strand:+ start:2501 stop:4099 length:1599 start_codon:yes stop_codon:yes gene_type:complete